MLKPAENIEGGHGLKRPTNGVHQGVQGGPPTTSDQRFEFGEHHLDRIEVWTVRGEVKQSAAPSFNERPYGRSVVGGEVVHHDHLSRLEGWTEMLAHVPLEGVPIDRSGNDQRGQWPRETQASDQGLVQAVVAGHLAHSAQVAGRAGVPARHGGVEAALVQEDQLGGGLKIRCQLVEERQTAFLTPFSSDQRFFIRDVQPCEGPVDRLGADLHTHSD